jgi:hypothetical protein
MHKELDASSFLTTNPERHDTEIRKEYRRLRLEALKDTATKHQSESSSSANLETASKDGNKLPISSSSSQQPAYSFTNPSDGNIYTFPTEEDLNTFRSSLLARQDFTNAQRNPFVRTTATSEQGESSTQQDPAHDAKQEDAVELPDERRKVSLNTNHP